MNEARAMSPELSRLLLAVSCALAAGVLAPSGFARVATDGTVGPRLELAGPDYAIDAELGGRAGENLFHSFERFSIETGGSVTFTGPSGVRNVISRVTGGARSDIDGALRSTIPGADFFFINPAGVVFGPNASLDVQGSFHVSTADELRFSDGAVFSATNPDASSLTVAAPEAFGFLGAQPAAITVDGGSLRVPEGETLSLVGGDIAISGPPVPAAAPSLAAAGGAVSLVSLAADGAVAIADGATDSGSRGEIRIDGGAVVVVRSGGIILVRADDLTIEDRSLLDASTLSDVPADGVIIDLTGDLVLRHSLIGTGSFATGSAGGIVVRADQITLDGGQI
jgi:filamentous hemagglutinin family protein